MSFQNITDELARLSLSNLYGSDFLRTRDKTEQELGAVFAVADALRDLHGRGISAKLFDSGLAVSLFPGCPDDTRLAFASACNMLGLTAQETQAAAHMAAPLADVVGIGGMSHAEMQAASAALQAGKAAGAFLPRLAMVSLGSDADHPTQTMADLLHLIHHFGGVEKLRGKKLAVTWVHSPSCEESPALPQGIIGLMTRFGMEVCLAHPAGYELMPEAEQAAAEYALRSGGGFTRAPSMDEALREADLVYPVSWTPPAVRERSAGRYTAVEPVETVPSAAELPAAEVPHTDWSLTREKLALTRSAVCLRELPAGLGGGCAEDGVSAPDVARPDGSRSAQVSHRAYVMAAMMFLAQAKDPVAVLRGLNKRNRPRSLL